MHFDILILEPELENMFDPLNVVEKDNDKDDEVVAVEHAEEEKEEEVVDEEEGSVS